MINDAVRRVLSHLEGVREGGRDRWKALCPCHDDHDPSLSIRVGDEGRVLILCRVCGAGAQQVVESIGLEMRHLFRGDGDVKVGKRILHTYDYLDTDGKLRHQTVRFDTSDPKQRFRQRRPDPDHPGRWIWNLKGVTPILYRLPDLLAADPGAIVFVVEGEKDADRLWSLGLVATTNPMGAGKWSCVDASPLDGRRIAIIPDNDVPGLKHAQDVAAERYGKSASVKVIELPGMKKAKGDVSDWLDAGGSE